LPLLPGFHLKPASRDSEAFGEEGSSGMGLEVTLEGEGAFLVIERDASSVRPWLERGRAGDGSAVVVGESVFKVAGETDVVAVLA